ncbi:MAG: hypothetical protein ACK42D_02410 [Candidatus Paceibacteria bacterium]
MSNNLGINILVSMVTAIVVSVAIFFLLQAQVSNNRMSTQSGVYDLEMGEPVLVGGEIPEGMASRAVVLRQEIQSVSSAIATMQGFLEEAAAASLSEEQRAEFSAEIDVLVTRRTQLEAEYQALLN